MQIGFNLPNSGPLSTVAAMTDIAELSVPMEVETKAGPNWNEMGPLA